MQLIQEYKTSGCKELEQNYNSANTLKHGLNKFTGSYISVMTKATHTQQINISQWNNHVHNDMNFHSAGGVLLVPTSTFTNVCTY